MHSTPARQSKKLFYVLLFNVAVNYHSAAKYFFYNVARNVEVVV